MTHCQGWGWNVGRYEGWLRSAKGEMVLLLEGERVKYKGLEKGGGKKQGTASRVRETWKRMGVKF